MRLRRTLLGRHPGQVDSCDPCASLRDARCRAQHGLAAAGFQQIRVRLTHQVAGGLHNAIITATRPAGGAADAASAPAAHAALPLAGQPGCCSPSGT